MDLFEKCEKFDIVKEAKAHVVNTLANTDLRAVADENERRRGPRRFRDEDGERERENAFRSLESRSHEFADRRTVHRLARIRRRERHARIVVVERPVAPALAEIKYGLRRLQSRCRDTGNAQRKHCLF